MLRRALATGRWRVAFQPIVTLPSGKIYGYEVLGRPPDNASALGLPTSPVELLNLAHREGLLLDLERTWRRIAIETISMAHLPAKPYFFLNVDPRLLDARGFSPGFTRRLLDRHGLSPRRFVFELTEAGPLLDSATLPVLLRHYAQQGFRVALDDVGAGFASLNSVVALRPHILKLDRALVDGIAHDRMRKTLVEALWRFCCRNRRHLIAEGVERRVDLEALVALGVPLAQGYLLGRPMAWPAPLGRAERSLFANEPAGPRDRAGVGVAA